MQEEAMADHDALIRLEGQVSALASTIAANNIASVERDTRIEQEVRRINGTIGLHDERIGILWNDRSIWNWVVRMAIVLTPIAVVGANLLTKH